MKEITSSQFDSEVLASQTPVLVDFYTSDCPPCRMMSPILQEIENQANGTLKVVKVDAAADSQFSASFRISAVPTFLLFNRGQRLGQVTGARSRKEMQKWLDDSIRAAA